MKYFTCAFALVAYIAGALGVATPVYAKPSIDTVWSVDVDQRLPNEPIALSVPALVGSGEDTLLVIAGRDGWIHIYDVNGSQIHRFFLGAPSDSPALALPNGHVVVGDIKGGLTVIDPLAGKIVWQKSLSAAFSSTPILVDNDFIVQTLANEIYRFSASGEKRWSYTGTQNTLLMYLGATPSLVQDRVYALLSNGDVVALKAYTGDLVWKRQLILSAAASNLSTFKGPLATPVYIEKLNMNGESVNKVVLAPIFQGTLSALSADNGSLLFDVPVSLKAAPLIVGQTMYLADGLGFLSAYNLVKGNRMWSKKITGSALLGPTLFQQDLWVTDTHGELYKIDLQGEIIAQKTFSGHIHRLPIVTEQGLIFRTDRGEMTLVK
jgi:outer membrane protein assembly factor BamB